MRLVDSHCHLQADRFDADVDQVIGAARLAGVERILVPGWDPDVVPARARARRPVPVARRRGRRPSARRGAGRRRRAGPRWRRSRRDPRVVATGETGLDYDRLFSPIPAQLANLRRNLRLAAETGKPAILHCRSAAGRRDAQDALLAEIRAFGATPPPVLIHSFSGPVDYAEAMLDLGAAISFSGLSFRAGEEATAEVARRTPADRILVETDSPFLSPPGAPRRRNEPEWVRVTAAWVADLRGQDRDAFGDQLVANYDSIFARRPHASGREQLTRRTATDYS